MPILGGLPGLEAIPVERFADLVVEEATVVVDVRDQLAFGAGHVQNSFGIGADGKLSTWASWVVPYDRPILLVVDHPGEVAPAVRALIRVGLDDVHGYLDGGMDAWRAAGMPLVELPQMTAEELHERLRSGEPVQVLDVRGDDEWTGGHIEGAQHIMGGYLPDRTGEVPNGDRTVVTVCRSGHRSTVAASVLQRAGRDRVCNLTGGMQAWSRAGLPMERAHDS